MVLPQERISVVHGDYRLDNTILPDRWGASINDWELSTLGDPMADFTYLLMRGPCRVLPM
jgi:aminoglycoside phosphotransferase (APT) family kinase protein